MSEPPWSGPPPQTPPPGGFPGPQYPPPTGPGFGAPPPQVPYGSPPPYGAPPPYGSSPPFGSPPPQFGGPYPPPMVTPPRKSNTNVIVLSVVGGVVVLVLAICGIVTLVDRGGGSGGGSGGGGGGGGNQGSHDAAILSCSTQQILDNLAGVAQVRITNTGSTSASYSVTVQFVSPDNRVEYDQAYATALNLPPGQSKDVEVVGFGNVTGDLKCVITSVERG